MNNSVKNVNSIFETDTWLNCVAEDSWERIEIRNKNGEVDAAFPFFKTRRYGFKIMTVPPLTQTLGIYIRDTGSKLAKRLEREKKLILQIISQLPKGYSYDFYLDVNNEYILPFIWKGFHAEPNFSYRIENLDDLDAVWSGFKENIRTDIRKAQKRVRVLSDVNVETLIDMQEKTFKRQNRSLPFDRDLIRKIDRVTKQNGTGNVMCAVDENDNAHAAACFIYDEDRCYYLLGGGDPQHRNSGATSLLLWEGIQFASKHSNVFDFEGSMIEDIERFVRGFGAKPRVYYRITKLNPALGFCNTIKPKVKKVLGYK